MGETDRAYAPRPLTFYGVEEFGDWRTKVYGIAVRGGEPRSEFVVAAGICARDVLAARQPNEKARAAFVIAHDARPACFVLVHWWQGVDLFQLAFRAPLDAPSALTPLETGAIGCVWELAIIAFERDAWLRNVVAGPNGADIDAYLLDVFEGSV
jgi:hypothetical protein